MVTQEMILTRMREASYQPMTVQELEREFGLIEAAAFKELVKVLNALEDAGYVARSRSDRYGLPEQMNLVRGRLQVNAKGFGFLLPDDRTHPDVYIGAGDMGTAMSGDTVLVRITLKSQGGARCEGQVIKVVERGTTQLVGLFEMKEGFAYVVPDDKRMVRDVVIPQTAFHGAMDGHKVVVRITAYPEGKAAAQGEVIEILGHANDPGVDILSIIRKHMLPETFSDEVMEAASQAPDTILPEELAGRRDLRDEQIVTIDGEDAKDLDDAVHVRKLSNGNYLLGVHIADVSYYVREGSPLDQEAYARGCSVYLVDRVIPMIPHRLSNGICSLNPRVDRLTMSCEMELDEQANIVRHDIFTSVIRTCERMTYTNVRKLLTGEAEPEIKERYAYLQEHFELMEMLASKLRKKRMQRGAIDFDFQEAKILVDADGKPTDIVKRERSVAESIIEEFMLAANETVAEHFYWLKVPFLYRVHEDPDSQKLFNFMEFITSFGYTVRGKGKDGVNPRALQSLLDEIKGTKEETVISTVLLRSMKQAKYSAESLGHFGLAAEFYSHFTSPIRRYPDLIIHRVIREVLENGGSLPDGRLDVLAEKMPDIAKQSSERERVAVEAERDTEALKKAEFMVDKVGETFSGIISSVTSFGFFVELDNTVEGLVRLSDLRDDYYHYHEDQHMLVGERTSRTYRLGDEITVLVSKVNMAEHTIDFAVVRPEGELATEVVGGGGRGRRRKDLPELLRNASKGGKSSKAGKGGKSKRKGSGERSGVANGAKASDGFHAKKKTKSKNKHKGAGHGGGQHGGGTGGAGAEFRAVGSAGADAPATGGTGVSLSSGGRGTGVAAAKARALAAAGASHVDGGNGGGSRKRKRR